MFKKKSFSVLNDVENRRQTKNFQFSSSCVFASEWEGECQNKTAKKKIKLKIQVYNSIVYAYACCVSKLEKVVKIEI